MDLKKNDRLKTPYWVYSKLGDIDLDPCADENTKIGRVNWAIERGEDGLEREWFGFVFCNPPFSQKETWVKKMLEHRNGILLLPERGSTPWHGPCADECKFHFTMGIKINFEGGSSSNPTGSTLFLFGDEAKQRVADSGFPGTMNRVEFFRARSAA